MAFAVHTRTCTYLLDEEGVCRWIISQRGVVPPHVQQCIGAQFVACLDLRLEGGLVAEIVPGAMALFVRTKEDRMVLLRTGVVHHVDDRRAVDQRRARQRAALPGTMQRGQLAYTDTRLAPTPPAFGVSYARGEEQTITVERGAIHRPHGITPADAWPVDAPPPATEPFPDVAAGHAAVPRAWRTPASERPSSADPTRRRRRRG
jgi:hypothetical protein